ncbi:NAD-dependent protein deacetylase sirtuin-2 [Puma concolor]|uniref:NAD-dependent protein deacetylase sirtuin-2 n=1 Tax=Puma concolor TaxID=9696 RepID=A0A6P6H4P1_PUMCO|nr:NAD-dependent protein deacetylase sirtuin-2 [Puma concolor]
MAEPDPSDPLETQAGKVQEAQDSDSDTEGGAAGGEAEMDFLRHFFSQTLGLGTQKERLLDELTLEGVTRYMQSERCRRVICLVGAGISTSAGIPDFRSPSTGLYANLEKYRLPYPEAIFEIGYFKKHPEPFFALAKELYPGQFKPTVCHYFIRLLKEKGLLLRCYTQNIDTLERVAGLEPEDLVEAHGTFYTSHCTSALCRREYTLSWMKGETDPFLGMMMGLGGGMDFDSKKAYRDVAWLGDCDQGCLALADLLGWKEELEDLVRKEHASIDAQQAGSGSPNPNPSTSPRKSPPPAKEEARTSEGEKPQ